eukprot:Hpha_TRINITY_DN11790_c0_g1::TRINITY_DN11790_c0_g1_i1::g.32036::m.32036
MTNEGRESRDFFSPPELFVVCVGTDRLKHYPDLRLRNAVSDVEAMAQMWERQEIRSRHAEKPRLRLKKLFNEDATSSNFWHHLAEVQNEAKQGRHDSIIIHWAGWGRILTEQKLGHERQGFVAYDSDTTGDKDISLMELSDWAGSVPGAVYIIGDTGFKPQGSIASERSLPPTSIEDFVFPPGRRIVPLQPRRILAWERCIPNTQFFLATGAGPGSDGIGTWEDKPITYTRLLLAILESVAFSRAAAVPSNAVSGFLVKELCDLVRSADGVFPEPVFIGSLPYNAFLGARVAQVPTSAADEGSHWNASAKRVFESVWKSLTDISHCVRDVPAQVLPPRFICVSARDAVLCYNPNDIKQPTKELPVMLDIVGTFEGDAMEQRLVTSQLREIPPGVEVPTFASLHSPVQRVHTGEPEVVFDVHREGSTFDRQLWAHAFAEKHNPSTAVHHAIFVGPRASDSAADADLFEGAMEPGWRIVKEMGSSFKLLVCHEGGQDVKVCVQDDVNVSFGREVKILKNDTEVAVEAERWVRLGEVADPEGSRLVATAAELSIEPGMLGPTGASLDWRLPDIDHLGNVHNWNVTRLAWGEVALTLKDRARGKQGRERVFVLGSWGLRYASRVPSEQDESVCVVEATLGGLFRRYTGHTAAKAWEVIEEAIKTASPPTTSPGLMRCRTTLLLDYESSQRGVRVMLHALWSAFRNTAEHRTIWLHFSTNALSVRGGQGEEDEQVLLLHGTDTSLTDTSHPGGPTAEWRTVESISRAIKTEELKAFAAALPSCVRVVLVIEASRHTVRKKPNLKQCDRPASRLASHATQRWPYETDEKWLPPHRSGGAELIVLQPCRPGMSAYAQTNCGALSSILYHQKSAPLLRRLRGSNFISIGDYLSLVAFWTWNSQWTYEVRQQYPQVMHLRRDPSDDASTQWYRGPGCTAGVEWGMDREGYRMAPKVAAGRFDFDDQHIQLSLGFLQGVQKGDLFSVRFPEDALTYDSKGSPSATARVVLVRASSCVVNLFLTPVPHPVPPSGPPSSHLLWLQRVFHKYSESGGFPFAAREGQCPGCGEAFSPSDSQKSQQAHGEWCGHAVCDACDMYRPRKSSSDEAESSKLCPVGHGQAYIRKVLPECKGECGYVCTGLREGYCCQWCRQGRPGEERCHEPDCQRRRTGDHAQQRGADLLGAVFVELRETRIWPTHNTGGREFSTSQWMNHLIEMRRRHHVDPLEQNLVPSSSYLRSHLVLDDDRFFIHTGNNTRFIHEKRRLIEGLQTLVDCINVPVGPEMRSVGRIPELGGCSLSEPRSGRAWVTGHETPVIDLCDLLRDGMPYLRLHLGVVEPVTLRLAPMADIEDWFITVIAFLPDGAIRVVGEVSGQRAAAGCWVSLDKSELSPPQGSFFLSSNMQPVTLLRFVVTLTPLFGVEKAALVGGQTGWQVGDKDKVSTENSLGNPGEVSHNRDDAPVYDPAVHKIGRPDEADDVCEMFDFVLVAPFGAEIPSIGLIAVAAALTTVSVSLPPPPKCIFGNCDNEADVTFLPCGHRVICRECVSMIRAVKCLQCKQPVQSTI